MIDICPESENETLIARATGILSAADDASFSLKHRHDFNRFAVVGAQAWFKWAMQLGSKFMEGQFMTFAPNDLNGAIAWAKAGPIQPLE